MEENKQKQKQEEQQNNLDPNSTLDLSEVAYMVMVGVDVHGNLFFRQSNVNDMMTIDALLSYARKKFDKQYDELLSKEKFGVQGKDESN